jgi:hypothetical protein
VKPLTRPQLTAVLGLDENVFDQRAYKERLPLGWGAVPATAGRYFSIDLICIRTSDELATMVGYEHAAALVRTHFGHIAETVARSDAENGQRAFFIALALAGEGKQLEYFLTSGLAEEVLEDLERENFPYRRVVLVNLTVLASELRERAHQVGVDLSEPFFLNPTHPQFRELIGAAEQARKEMVAALKKRDPERASRHRLKRLGKSLRRPQAHGV